MLSIIKSIASADAFNNFITAVIVLAGVLIGIETYPSATERWGGIMHVLDQIILWIFVAEVAIKMTAEAPKPWRYFRDPWNCFDFVIVAACFVPGAGSYAVILRLARLLRVLKLVRALPRLQLLVSALLKSIPSMFYVTLLLGLLFYVYAVAATFLFGPNDPLHFSSLHLSMLSLFRVVTLEDWTDVMYIAMYGCDQYGYSDAMIQCTQPEAQPIVGAVFFASFVLIGTMVILNLFIGVILKSMEDTALEQELFLEAERLAASGEDTPDLISQLSTLSRDLEALQGNLARIRHQLDQRGGGFDTPDQE